MRACVSACERVCVCVCVVFVFVFVFVFCLVSLVSVLVSCSFTCYTMLVILIYPPTEISYLHT